MAPTPQDRAAFGTRLRELRIARDLKQSDVVNALKENGGTFVTEQSFSEYERGISSPSFKNVKALERILGEPEGSLGGMLGYRGDDPGLEAQVAELRAEVTQLREDVRKILRRLGGRGS